MACAGCGERVCDRFFLLAAGGAWHGACLRCSRCRCELQTQPSLFWRDGNIYCQQDYCRAFGGGRCARCCQPIPASALVMRAGQLTFHPHCFCCQVDLQRPRGPERPPEAPGPRETSRGPGPRETSRGPWPLETYRGNLYCMQGQSLYCQSHYGDAGRDPPPRDPQPDPSLREALNQASGEGEESVSSPEPLLDDRAAGGRTRRRTKRIRTCFRSEQLRALESYFAQKHNPDGKDWNCLAHKTGLPKRVLQVWFQNARAKLRRSVTTDDSQVDSPSAYPGGGVALAPDPPPDRSLAPPPLSSSASTIDQLQLSLLTAPLSEPAGSPASLYLDYDSQSAPGCLSSLEVFEDFEEAGAAEGGGHPHGSFAPHYC
ncbi:LIM/homeobox protein Lhx9-like [Pseudoliparis swirei]|uniref:LIM/homeobox protein Lhx9-like n=1 Tax=Pseudoliparis swirei TaxID=2059687 RepID=UPI0024BDC59F|nr:LIM/homeobox protein Lhx9-like [Pseudoliparis swirei]